MRSLLCSAAVKLCGSTMKLQLKLERVIEVDVGGVLSVAVIYIDITQNSDCEGS